MRPTTPNILRVYDAATPDQMSAGMTWYSDAYALAASLDSNIRRAAAVIAVLSPMKQWEENTRLAKLAYANGGLDGGTLSDHVRKVNRLLRAGESPEAVVSGEKVTAFFNGIASNGMTDIVTVDRHAFDVAMGRRFSETDRNITRSIYGACERAYLRAAKARGVSGAQCQAVTWITWREMYMYTR